jgi:hypothetical protein
MKEIGTATVDALRAQPLVLALVVLQAIVLVIVLYSSINRQASIDKQFVHVFELLATCVVR